WLWPDDTRDVVVDEREQARALAALLGAAVRSERVRGAFVWRYYAKPRWRFAGSDLGLLAPRKARRAGALTHLRLAVGGRPVLPPWDPGTLSPLRRWPELFLVPEGPARL